MTHKQGEAMDGTSLVGKPIILEPWQIFIVYNLVGFYYKGTTERRYKEAFVMVGRKNGKTTFLAALAWALSLLERASGSRLYIVAGSAKQACQSFDVIVESIRANGAADEFRILDNNREHSLSTDFFDDYGERIGSLKIEALAANPDAQDSFNCNIAIADEIHSFKRPRSITASRRRCAPIRTS